MQVEDFFKFWKIREHPFRAEEARDDPVFGRLQQQGLMHPDFQKIRGEPDRPASSIVFGEKGAGKTAIRLMLEQQYRAYAHAHPGMAMWVVRYDDLNGVLDSFSHSMKRPGDAGVLERLRLSDHQDALISRVVTELVSGILGDQSGQPLGHQPHRTARRMSRSQREDLAVLAAIYDQPQRGNVTDRQRALGRVLRLRWIDPRWCLKWGGAVLGVLALGLAAWSAWQGETGWERRLVAGALAAGWISAWMAWGVRNAQAWRLARRIRREVHAVQPPPVRLRQMLGLLRRRDLLARPLPVPGDHDSRYQMTARLLGILRNFGYMGLIVLVDRIDEPAMVRGEPKRMRSIIWPMLDNKFLQQDGVGVKMLLPIELRHLLLKEDADFFQKARLDKQHTIDRLSWSGTTLYDLCTQRLLACREPDAEPMSLRDLFEEEVSRQELIDALEQMHQPRDAFKFLYQVIQEHCLSVPHDQPRYRIAQLTLQQIRKFQAQRVQDLQRGLAPA